MMFRWGSPRRNNGSPLAPRAESPNGHGASSTVNGGTGAGAGTGTGSITGTGSLRPPRGNAAIEALRTRVRSSSASIPARPGPLPTIGGGTPARAVASALSPPDRGRTREAMQTASAPAVMAPLAARSSTPPPYSQHSLDRSPLPNPMALDDRPRVPPPIYLRSSSNQPQSKLGTLTIHVPGWQVYVVDKMLTSGESRSFVHLDPSTCTLSRRDPLRASRRQRIPCCQAPSRST
jgi:hypothetical protein